MWLPDEHERASGICAPWSIILKPVKAATSPEGGETIHTAAHSLLFRCKQSLRRTSSVFLLICSWLWVNTLSSQVQRMQKLHLSLISLVSLFPLLLLSVFTLRINKTTRAPPVFQQMATTVDFHNRSANALQLFTPS